MAGRSLQKIYDPLCDDTVSTLDAKALASDTQKVCNYSGKPSSTLKLHGPRISIELAPTSKLLLACPDLEQVL